MTFRPFRDSFLSSEMQSDKIKNIFSSYNIKHMLYNQNFQNITLLCVRKTETILSHTKKEQIANHQAFSAFQGGGDCLNNN